MAAPEKNAVVARPDSRIEIKSSNAIILLVIVIVIVISLYISAGTYHAWDYINKPSFIYDHEYPSPSPPPFSHKHSDFDNSDHNNC